MFAVEVTENFMQSCNKDHIVVECWKMLTNYIDY